MEYIKRIVDREVEKKLRTMGAVLIRGPKWCGKTRTANQYAKSVLEMQNPDLQENYQKLANTKPSLLLKGEKPRLLDEWQLAPNLWNAVRYEVDKGAGPGQFLLTGSATPVDDPNMHSGVGRFAFIDMKPMSLYESSESNGSISLKALFDKKIDIDGKTTDYTYENLVYPLCRGGWPNSLDMDKEDALNVAKEYVKSLTESDISRIDDTQRNPILARAILRSYGRNISTIESDTALFKDVKANYSEVSDKTITNYIKVLKRLFIIQEITSWNPNIRSKTSIRTSPKKSMIDPSIATAALECSPEELMMDFNTYGLLFENLVARDLSIYVNAIGGYLNHYRDRFGLECDLVIHLNNGKYALAEVKLSGDEIPVAEQHLLELKKLIEGNKRLREPDFMMIVTATDLAYTTDSGIHIVPLGCLKN